MSHDRLLTALGRSSPLPRSPDRRRVLQTLGAATATSLAAMAAGRPAFAQSRPLNILTWDGYMEPRLLDGFRAQTGTRVSPEGHVSDPTSVNRLRAGEVNVWDFINVNNPWARKILWPENLIVDLPRDRFEPYFDKMVPKFKPPYPWAMSVDNQHLLGVCQRYENFDFVINTDRISVDLAQNEGWDLFNNSDMAGRYGILTYDNWNVIHICMGAGVHPFRDKTEADFTKFEETAQRWINGAKLLSVDFGQLNQAMLNGEIDAYITGGTYTVSAARLDGLNQFYAACPESGPADGFGGVTWIELNSAVNNPNMHPNALDFLEYILQPESAHAVATANGLLQPVAQMGQPEVFALFTVEELNAIQFDTLDYRMSHAVEYDIVPGEARLMEIYGAAIRGRG
jgi:spermidine/putrescine transport system substrate-binding protein